jgi:hypothetical protein
MIWFSIGITFATLSAAAFYTYFYARVQYTPEIPSYQYLQILSYVFFGLAGIVLLAILLCFNTIKISIAVFKTTISYIK